MSYLLDKKIKRNKIFKITLGVVVLIILFYFRLNIFNGLSFVGQVFFRPILVVGQNIGQKFNNIGSYFVSKNSLSLENQNLKDQISASAADRANYDSVVAENVSLKETLGRKDPKVNIVLSAILAKPNQSLYDTLLIDAGTAQGIKTGDIVFALGNIPIGRVDLVYDNSSKIILFSNPGEKTQAVVSSKNIFMELVGRGGGNFEMILPRDFVLQKGDQIVMPGITPNVLAIAQTIISDPRDPFIKALLVSPVNVQELKFVEVEI
ncbi:MAG: rod shape-determining protein MreC [Candidatus Pacebacteria bacterium]|nr:rod shape-determining protein MreC [Candidatus Paceibacterota bacterium]